EMVEEPFDVAGLDGLLQLLGADARLETRVDPAPGVGGQDDPGLGLAVVAYQTSRRLVVGMDLDRERLMRVDELDQQRELLARPRRRTQQLRAPGPDQLAEGRPGP